MSTVSGNYYGGIVIDGLVLLLDAAKRDSYPKTGTAWNDISRNGNNGTLINGPTFNVGNGGSIVFDGTNDHVASFPSLISPTGTKTVLCFIYLTTTVRAGICGTRPTIGSSGWLLTTNRTTPGNLTYAHPGGSVIEVTANIPTNTWTQVGVVYNSTSATVSLFKNGSQVGATSTNFSAEAVTTFNGVIGDEDQTVSTPFKGNIAQVSIYNRALSASEISQNFNATRARFGI